MADMFHIDKSSVLVVITARAGSKGLPNKNIKPLNGKPLILYTVEAARSVFRDEQICVSSDGSDIINIVESSGLKVPFVRPAELATDQATTPEVLLHAIRYFEQQGHSFEYVLNLQPTSPLRTSQHIVDLLAHFDPDPDMLVSVFETHQNPYFTLFEEDNEGYLKISKKSDYTRRQDCPPAYVYNGAMYLIKIASLKKERSVAGLKKIKKYVMSQNDSIDIDTDFDFFVASHALRYKDSTNKSPADDFKE